VHADEMLSAFGHPADADAIRSLLADEEVDAWLRNMREKVLLPEKR
jgi:hypothetical protein